MKFIGIFFRKRISFSLDCINMYNHGSMQIFRPAQGVAQLIQIMSVHWSKILKSHIFKKAAGPKCFFHAGFF